MDVDEDDSGCLDIEYVKMLKSSLVRLDYVQQFPAWGRGRSVCPPKPSDYQQLQPGGLVRARLSAIRKVTKGRGAAIQRSSRLLNGDDSVLPAVGLQSHSRGSICNSQWTNEKPKIENQFTNAEELIDWAPSKAKANIVTPSQSNLQNHIFDDRPRSQPASACDFRPTSNPNAQSVSLANGPSSPQTVDDIKKDLSIVSYDNFAVEVGRRPSSDAAVSAANSEFTKSSEKSDDEDQPRFTSDFPMPPAEESPRKQVGRSAGRRRVPLSTMLSEKEAKDSTNNGSDVQSKANSSSTKSDDSELTISKDSSSKKVILPDAAAASREMDVSPRTVSPVKVASIPTVKKPVVFTSDLPSCDVGVAAISASPNKSKNNSNLLKSEEIPLKKVPAVKQTKVPATTREMDEGPWTVSPMKMVSIQTVKKPFVFTGDLPSCDVDVAAVSAPPNKSNKNSNILKSEEIPVKKVPATVPTANSSSKSKVLAAEPAQRFTRAPSKFMKNDVSELPKFKDFRLTWETETPDPRVSDTGSSAIPEGSFVESIPASTTNILKSEEIPVKKVPAAVPTVKSSSKSKVLAAEPAQLFTRAPSKFMKNDVSELPKFKDFRMTWETETPDLRVSDAGSSAIPEVPSVESIRASTTKANQTIVSSGANTNKLEAFSKRREIPTQLHRLPNPPEKIASGTESSYGPNSNTESESSVEIAITPIKAKPRPAQKKTLRNLAATSTTSATTSSDECKSSHTVPKTWEEAQLLNPVKFDEFGRAIVSKMKKFCLAHDFPSLPVPQEPKSKLSPLPPTPAPTKEALVTQLPVVKTSKRKRNKKKQQSSDDKEQRTAIDVSTVDDLDKIKDAPLMVKPAKLVCRVSLTRYFYLRVSETVADLKRSTIVVDNLPDDTSKGVLYDCLECFGAIEGIKMVHLPYGRHAEVTFIGEVNVEWVIDIMHNSSLSDGGKPLCVWEKDGSVAID